MTAGNTPVFAFRFTLQPGVSPGMYLNKPVMMTIANKNVQVGKIIGAQLSRDKKTIITKIESIDPKYNELLAYLVSPSKK